MPAGFSASALITFFSSVCVSCQPRPLTSRAPDCRAVSTLELFSANQLFRGQTSTVIIPPQVTLAVRAHVFSFLLKIESLVKYLFFVVARNRGFPAIVFSVVSRSFVFFNLLVFSS